MRRICFSTLLIGILSWAGQSFATPLPDIELTPKQLEKLNIGEPVSEVSKAPDGQVDVFGVIHIQALPEKIWAIMKNCDKQLNIIPDMKACNILETDPEGSWDRREQIMKIGFPLPNVRSEFRSDYTPFETIKITRTGGDLSVLNGEWTLQLLNSGKTQVAYRARMKSRLPVPRRFIRKGVEKDMPQILSNLKNTVEAQAR